MPRRSSGPRLWFDKSRGTWTIIDGRRRSRTGFGKTEVAGAEKALGEYIGSKHVVKDGPNPFLADVLSAYATEHLAGKPSESHILYDIEKLTAWWGAKTVREITASNCRAYVAFRDAPGCAWRELAFLRAAIRYWHREHGPLAVLPAVTMPPKPEARAEFISRDEAAKFLWHARKAPHLARFFLIGWYTGSRRSVITGLKWSMVDLDSGVMLRKPRGSVQTKKKAPKVRIGFRLMAHLRRWKRMDGKAEYIIRYRGKRIFRPLRTWERARIAAGLPEHVTAHILRHSRATHMMAQRVDPWEAAKSLGMSLKMLLEVYGHHHPDWQKDAADAR